MHIEIDDIDLNILNHLINLSIGNNSKNSITTTSLARKIFPNLNRNDLLMKDNLIRHRLKKLNFYGIILIEKKNNVTYYDLIANNCTMGKLKNKKAIYLNIKENWCAFSLNGFKK